jgi:hypothetical protein
VCGSCHTAPEPRLPVPNATASPSPCGTYGQTKRNANAEESFLQLQCMRSIVGLAAHAWGALGGGCCCCDGGSLQGISGTRTPPAHLPAVFGVVGSSALRHRRRAPQSTRAHGWTYACLILISTAVSVIRCSELQSSTSAATASKPYVTCPG